MKKRLIVSALAAIMAASSTIGGLSAGAFDEWSYSEDLTVYVNGEKIDDQYKPIIVNDRTLVRLVPIFEALGYNYIEMDENNVIKFYQKMSNTYYSFKAESTTAVGPGGMDYGDRDDGLPNGEEYTLDVPATLQYFDVFYVPIRSFCEMTNLDIEWDAARRNVYIGTKPTALADITAQASTSNRGLTDPGKLLGNAYCAAGYDLGSEKSVEGQYLNGEITKEEIAELIATTLHQTAEQSKTGVTVQKALDMIKAGYDIEVTGTAIVYENYVIVNDATADDLGLKSYCVSYNTDDGLYYTLASGDEDIINNFYDGNGTGRVLNANGEVVSFGN